MAPLADGESLTVGPHRLKAVRTPGHTPGSTSYLLDGKYLFTGDTVMKSSVGRPDLGGQVRAWGRMLFDTLFNRLGHLPDETVILPAHSVPVKDEDSEGLVRLTLGEARRGLDLFQDHNPEAFIQHIEASLLENPARYQEIRQVNLGLLHPEESKLKELEIGRNLCGMAKKPA
jgi:glyoxylase-like metal-dependent hydrolase (beta-lactamase superfamily II)